MRVVFVCLGLGVMAVPLLAQTRNGRPGRRPSSWPLRERVLGSLRAADAALADTMQVGARRSPGTADFGRLRSLLRDQALRPASSVAVRNALRLEEEARGWLEVQQRIAEHLRTLSEITAESLRAAQRE